MLGRRRFEVTGRFGLRASPGGFATPAFGDQPEVVRVSGTLLVHEVGGEVAAMSMEGATLGEMAAFAGADLSVPFAPGDDGPELGDPSGVLTIDAGAARRIADWFELGWRVLDEVLGHQSPQAAPATVQLWPEHFDVGTNLVLPPGDARVNLGFSPGDAFDRAPYAYVGPWSDERHGDPAFWNAPFGAVLRASRVPPDAPERMCAEFLREGIRHASSR